MLRYKLFSQYKELFQKIVNICSYSNTSGLVLENHALRVGIPQPGLSQCGSSAVHHPREIGFPETRVPGPGGRDMRHAPGPGARGGDASLTQVPNTASPC